MIYADEAAMMEQVLGNQWPGEIYNCHEIAEQIYADWTGLSEAAGE